MSHLKGSKERPTLQRKLEVFDLTLVFNNFQSWTLLGGLLMLLIPHTQ